MGKNVVRKDYFSDTTFTAPAGVTQIKVTATCFLFSQLSGGVPIAISSSGDAYSWGSNGFGSCGLGDIIPRSSPVLVLGAIKWRQVAGSGLSTCGISFQGDAYAWGINGSGQLGVGDVTSRSSPVLVLGGLKWRQISNAASETGSGGNSILAIDTSGSAYAWGANTNGQLGVGDVIPRSSPVLVLGGLKWRQIASGGSSIGTGAGGSMAGIDSNGDLYAWGDNRNGQLGLGDVVSRSSPVLVLGGLKFKSISGGSNCFRGIDQFGNAYSWGNNISGQLGVGDVIPRSSPVLVLGGIKWRTLSGLGAVADFGSTIGIAENGSAYAWGYNANGQLGVGDVIPRSSPVLVLGGLKWRQVSTSGQTLGISATGDIYAWGANGSVGPLGIGNYTPQSSPVIVLGGIKYQNVYQTAVNSLIIDVVPGTVYDVKTFGIVALFNYISLYQDPYNSGSIPMKITLEYEA